ncbi:hypothetical protein NBRC116584_16250 [Hydrogenophaga sp. 5NK40-0174]
MPRQPIRPTNLLLLIANALSVEIQQSSKTGSDHLERADCLPGSSGRDRGGARRTRLSQPLIMVVVVWGKMELFARAATPVMATEAEEVRKDALAANILLV